MLSTLAVSGYRSLREVIVPLGPLVVVTGPNGSGKSSLYRALHLLSGCARGDVVSTLAREGGLQSALWAGPANLDGVRRSGHEVQGTMRSGPISLRLGFASDDVGYLVDLGLPAQAPGYESAFLRDPEIKREIVFIGAAMRSASTVVRRRWSIVQERDGRGWRELTRGLAPWDSMLAELADPRNHPELSTIRRQLRDWRFYDGFRADAHAPARQPQIGTRTVRLADDGHNLAAALQTIREQDSTDLDRAIADAFNGARLEVDIAHGRFEVLLHQPGMLRPLAAPELSEGTLRYLLWCAALLSIAPPTLTIINEPETSLHDELIAPLARMIRRAARDSQVVVVTHSAHLIDELGPMVDDDDDELPDQDEGAESEAASVPARLVRLEKDLGETRVVGQGMLSTPPWNWGSRR